MIGSLIPEVYAGFKAALEDDTDLATAGADGGQIQIADGRPRSVEKHSIVLGNTDDAEQEAKELGNRRRRDEFTIRVHVNVVRQDEAAAVRARALEISRRVEAVLGAQPDPPFGVAGVLSAQIGRYRIIGPAPAGDVGIECEAQLYVVVKTLVATR